LSIQITYGEIPLSQLSNYTFEELSIGQSAQYSKTVGEDDIKLFAASSGDVNPVHLDAEFAAGTRFGERIAHGMLTGAYISAAIAMELPGPGTIYLGQSLRFRLPVTIGDTVTVQLEITELNERRKFVTLECTVVNQDDKIVATGTAEVMAPTDKMLIDRPATPEVVVR
jgi:acyl dehydratase